MNFWLEVVLGAVAAVLAAAWFARYSKRGEVKAYAQGLFIAALIYVAFGLFGGASMQEIFIELGGLVFYGGLAAAGLRAPLILAFGWAAHVGWDILLHHPAEAWVPSWYPGVCLGFDVVFAVVLAWRMRDR